MNRPFVQDHAIERWVLRGGPVSDGLVWRSIQLAYWNGERLSDHGLDWADEVRYDEQTGMITVRVGQSIKTVINSETANPPLRRAIEQAI